MFLRLTGSESVVETTESDIFILALYAFLLTNAVIKRGPSYQEGNPALPWHVLAGALEVVHYYAGFRCSVIAVLCCYIHSATSMIMVKRLQKGYPPITRSIYQAAAIARIVSMTYAYYTQNADNYHDAIMPIHAFIYTRFLLFVFGTMGPSGLFTSDVNSKHVYSLAVAGAGCMSYGHVHSKWGVMTYLALVNITGKMRLWSRGQYDYYTMNNLEVPKHIKFMRFIGVFQFENPSEKLMQSKINDGPKIGPSAMGSLGHWWCDLPQGRAITYI